MAKSPTAIKKLNPLKEKGKSPEVLENRSTTKANTKKLSGLRENLAIHRKVRHLSRYLCFLALYCTDSYKMCLGAPRDSLKIPPAVKEPL